MLGLIYCRSLSMRRSTTGRTAACWHRYVFLYTGHPQEFSRDKASLPWSLTFRRLFALFLGGTAENDSAYCDTCYRSMVYLSVWPSAHSCTMPKPLDSDEMPFDRDTRVVGSNIVLDRSPGPSRGGEIWGSKPPVRSYAAYRPFF